MRTKTFLVISILLLIIHCVTAQKAAEPNSETEALKKENQALQQDAENTKKKYKELESKILSLTLLNSQLQEENKKNQNKIGALEEKIKILEAIRSIQDESLRYMKQQMFKTAMQKDMSSGLDSLLGK
ncbi:MAG TPA: hypothetical protein DC049_09035 [Spirochaetia bacterium]|nr:hypothetical protein [Spirochaetia bacterium]